MSLEFNALKKLLGLNGSPVMEKAIKRESTPRQEEFAH